MDDATEDIRRAMVNEINADPGGRAALEARHGRIWDTAQMTADFAVLGFMAPLVAVRRKADGRRGSLKFQHHPRYYYGFEEG